MGGALVVEKKKTLMVVGASALAAAGCGSTDPLDRESTPLALEEARFLSATQVQLTFTRNLAAVDEVSAAKFALSQGSSFDLYFTDTYGYYIPYAGFYGTYYGDLGRSSANMFDYADVGYAYTGSPAYAVVEGLYADYQADYANGFPSINVTALELVAGHSNQIVLTLSRALPPTVLDTGCGDGFQLLVCGDYMSALEAYYASDPDMNPQLVGCNGGFMVHFDAAGVPNVETRKGDQTLATIGGALFDPPTPNAPTVLDPTRKILCPL